MFKIVLVACLLGLAAAASVDQAAEIRSLTNEPADAEGNFAYAFDTTNGIAVQESGNVAGVTGAIQYISPEGEAIEIKYTADQDGYHPVGNHLPTPPPIPEYIIRAIEYINAHPQQDEPLKKVVSSSPFRG
ncbi:pupal cuticle protein Edg-78E-like [Episyrphus balteatus]|uniref:pupal cuticle protein Edg-78E-like n=1 Tax=Episyrphus balteatus TaxID=286459 RepID=UPI0024868EB2|nr:pupal cuticle protein Edg-78E-like [Episyrphus balteatus]